jgi:hypothetical protein
VLNGQHEHSSGSSSLSTRVGKRYNGSRKLLYELSIDTVTSPRGWNLLVRYGFILPGLLIRDFVFPFDYRKII